MTVPDYSPAMLAAFLRAQCWKQVGHGAIPGKAKRAWSKLRPSLRRATGLSAKTLDLAFEGKLGIADCRAKIWGALGQVPADYGVTLLDFGGQQPEPTWIPSQEQDLQWTRAAQTAIEAAGAAA